MSQDERNEFNVNHRETEKVPDPEVVARARRRTFSAEYKLRILQEADACTEPGQIGALLRREGLYSSHLTDWRRARAAGQLAALGSRKRGPKPDPTAQELDELRRENERLRTRLQQAEIIVDVQKKLSQLLGLTPSQTETDEST